LARGVIVKGLAGEFGLNSQAYGLYQNASGFWWTDLDAYYSKKRDIGIGNFPLKRKARLEGNSFSN